MMHAVPGRDYSIILIDPLFETYCVDCVLMLWLLASRKMVRNARIRRASSLTGDLCTGRESAL